MTRKKKRKKKKGKVSNGIVISDGRVVMLCGKTAVPIRFVRLSNDSKTEN